MVIESVLLMLIPKLVVMVVEMVVEMEMQRHWQPWKRVAKATTERALSSSGATIESELDPLKRRKWRQRQRRQGWRGRREAGVRVQTLAGLID